MSKKILLEKNINIIYIMVQRCDGWCSPAIIYVILAVIGIALTALKTTESQEDMDVKLTIIFRQILFVGIWTGLLYWLCYICRPGWAWFILIGPFLIGLALLFLLGIIVNLNQ